MQQTHKKPRGVRVLWLVLVLVAVVSGAFLLGVQDWIADRFYLFQLSRAGFGERKQLIHTLVARGCPAVTPYLLDYFRDHPFEGTMGFRLADHEARVYTVVSIGPGVIPYLGEALDAGHPEESVVFSALEEFGERSSFALPSLIRYLSARRDGGRVDRAIDVVGSIGDVAEGSVATLLTFERDNRRLVRYSLYSAFGKIGSGAQEAIPLLLDALDFEEGENLLAAAEAIGRISPNRPEAISGLVACIRDARTHDYERSRAARLLGEMGQRAHKAVPGLMVMLADGDNDAVLAAGRALDRISPDQGFEFCRQRARESAVETRLNGILALGGFRSRVGEVLPLLIDATRDTDEEVAIAAVQALGHLGDSAKKSVPRLLEICRQPRNDTFLSVAINSLGLIGVSSPEVLTTFQEDILPNVTGDGIDVSARALARLASNDPSVVQMLVLALSKDGNLGAKSAAIEALKAVGRTAVDAILTLEAIAGQEDGELAEQAKDALEWISEDPQNPAQP